MINYNYDTLPENFSGIFNGILLRTFSLIFVF